ncbi:hypothetical protein [Vibrio splendidus]|uniref:hypothetical protein n=1 Tax=Vibrio splendidus TaxID=29497 RepID=UPI00021C2F3F|nr:hypothetical protein [Vibrio splendidus]EGU38064.1 hypothetical protein VISP3789_17048 [Vibrio splendidus ATCC 33789]
MKLGTLFVEHVIKPVLDHLDMVTGGHGKLNTPAAIRLILMIVAHESGALTYAKQVRGPALGFTQMEPATFAWLIEWLGKTRPHLLDALSMFAPLTADSVEKKDADYMVISPQFAVATARLNLIRFPEALPEADDLEGLARYAKRYWNTSAGKATEADYLNAYLSMMGEQS